MIKQLKIKLVNKPGTLQGCVETLAGQGLDIKALEVTKRGNGEHGEVHLIVSNLIKATAALDAGQYDYQVEDVLAAEMDDHVGGLAAILALLGEKDINIQHLYAFIGRVRGKSLAVISVADPVEAQRLLKESGVSIIPEASLEDKGDSNSEFNITMEDHFGKDFIW